MTTPTLTPTSEDALALLTPETLREWLASKPADQPVGYEMRRCGCPIAEFFREREIAVEIGSAMFLDSFAVQGQAPVKLPRWAETFARSIDEGDASEPFPISAEEAEGLHEADTDVCAADAPHAIAESGHFYHHFLYRPMAGKTLSELDRVLSAVAAHPEDFENDD